MKPTQHTSPFCRSVGLAGSILALVLLVACSNAASPTATSSATSSSLTSSLRTTTETDTSTTDTQHYLLMTPSTSKTYALSIVQTATGQTIQLQDASSPKTQILLHDVQNVVSASGSMDYKNHTLFVIRRIPDENQPRDELWAYTKEGGKRLMQGRDIRFSVSPLATTVAVSNANALQMIDVRNGTLTHTVTSSDLPADLVAKKERFFGKATTLTPWTWSDDGATFWFSADVNRPYAFAKLTVADNNIETFELKKDFTATDTALNANTGNMALSDASETDTTKKVTLSILNLATNEAKVVSTGTGGALHPQWLNDDTLFITKNGKKTPISLR